MRNDAHGARERARIAWRMRRPARVEFFSRKRDDDGERYRWHHLYDNLDDAKRTAEQLRAHPDFRGKVRIEVHPVRRRRHS